MNELISIILPTYNESGHILDLIEVIHTELKEHSHEIVLVDDNSPDQTYNKVQKAGHPYVKCLLRTENPSLAASIFDGITQAKGSIIVVMDTDFNHQPKYIPQMLSLLDTNYDCISASRYLAGGGMNNFFRHIFSKAFNTFIKVSLKSKLSDHLYGYFVIKKNILKEYPLEKIFYGYGDYYIRLLYYLQKHQINIKEIPAKNGRRRSGQGNSKWIKTLIQYTEAVWALKKSAA